MRFENTWQEIRDHSFIQNHSRSSDSQIHDGASSVHLTHLLQGSGQRAPDERSEIIPSSRITPDPSDSQIHDGASSVHSLMFYRVQVRGLGWPAEAWCCVQWPIYVVFEVCVWIIVRLDDPNMAHYNNNNNNLLHLYSAFLDTQSALHSKGAISSSTTNIIIFLTEWVTCWFFICWYLIESMMSCV